MGWGFMRAEMHCLDGVGNGVAGYEKKGWSHWAEW